MWTTFKVFIDSVTILLLFYVLVFWLWGTWESALGPGIEPAPSASEGGILTTGPPEKSQEELLKGWGRAKSCWWWHLRCQAGDPNKVGWWDSGCSGTPTFPLSTRLLKRPPRGDGNTVCWSPGQLFGWENINIIILFKVIRSPPPASTVLGCGGVCVVSGRKFHSEGLAEPRDSCGDETIWFPLEQQLLWEPRLVETNRCQNQCLRF